MDPDWLKLGAVDFASLAPLPASYVSHDLRQRHGDLVWRVRFHVIYNGRRRWNAPADVSELIASGGAALARYQPSQRYFLLDEGRVGDAALPGGWAIVGNATKGRNRFGVRRRACQRWRRCGTVTHLDV